MTKRDVRAEVLAAVYSVCAEVGLENLTTKRISEAANASEAMIYYHFKNKTDILEKAFLNIHSQIDDIFRENFISRGFVLEKNLAEVCAETWMLYYGYWKAHPAQRAFYESFIHSRFVSTELWLRDNASYVFFSSVFGSLMGRVAEKSGKTAFSFIWTVIIESAISMAKRALETGEDPDEQVKQIMLGVFNAILTQGR